jgi:inorganic triphosphatase YgiF
VRIVDHAYAEIEIEAELKRGNVQGLALIRQAIEGLGRVTESNGSKLSRAMAHLETCHCRA